VKLITGLGNPTRKYRMTRHNVGFLALDRIANDLSVCFRKSLMFGSFTGEGRVGGQRVYLLKPLKFMNLSGRVLGPYARKKGIKPDELIVICDDVNLDLGRIRIRKSGSSGGHNGLKSIIEALGTEEFARLRIGIGGTKAGANLSDYVLDEFRREELILMDKVLGAVSEAARSALTDGIENVMSKYNSVSIA
jgi:PTH1 family peptidyl-tRNA hydrolase